MEFFDQNLIVLTKTSCLQHRPA